MTKYLVLAALLFAVIACNKDKFQTRPQISIKSVSSSVVPANGGLNIDLSYTDKEGDISDTLFIKKVRLNKTIVATLRDSIRYKIPDFPDYDRGVISVALTYQNDLVSAQNPPPIPGSNPPQPQPDTLNILIWIHDRAGNVSDTVSTGPVVIIR